MKKVINPKSLRDSNRSTLLWQIYNKGALSRKELAKYSSLTSGSVSQLIKDLINEGIVYETVECVQRNNTGRREVLVDICYDKYCACGVNVEGDNIHISVCTLKMVLFEKILKTKDVLKGDASILIDEIFKVINQYPNVMGLTVGIVGVVDEKNGIVINSYGLLPKDYLLKQELTNRFDFDIKVINNVKVQAKSLINEINGNFLYIKHSPGLGCAVVVDHHIIEGNVNNAGELGHTIVKVNGEKCKCGKRGCLEVYVAEEGIVNTYFSLTGKTKTISKIYSDYDTDKDAKTVLDDCIDKLALSISNACALTSPQKILVTGGIFFEKKLFDLLEEKINEYGGNIKMTLIDNSFMIKATAEAKYMIKNHLFEV